MRFTFNASAKALPLDASKSLSQRLWKDEGDAEYEMVASRSGNGGCALQVSERLVHFQSGGDCNPPTDSELVAD